MTEQDTAEKDRLAREAQRMASRKDARDMEPDEWKKALANTARQKPAPLQLPDARTLSDAEYRRALAKINLLTR